jgi:hypothetical protein
VVAVDTVKDRVYMVCGDVKNHNITSLDNKAVQVVNRFCSVTEDEIEPVAAIERKCMHWLMLTPENIQAIATQGQFRKTTLKPF